MKACNCQKNLVIALHALCLLFWDYINTLGRYEPLVSSTKELHGLAIYLMFMANGESLI